MVAATRTPDSAPWNSRRHASNAAGEQRTSYEVDRDRIIHSSTFRDLQHKTQVQSLLGERRTFIFRTRLNHVLEVAQIARGVARLLDADEPLCEAVALAHDLGHPPFGHAGERALRDALRHHGREGWNANVHSLEVVDRVEAAFMQFRGLNLTYALREGIARHSTPFDEPVSFGEFAELPNGGLECQIVDLADVFAYLSHDLDDALAAGYITFEDTGHLPEMNELVESALRAWKDEPTAWPPDEADGLIRKRVIAILLYRLINDTARRADSLLEERGLGSALAVREAEDRVVVPAEHHAELVTGLLEVLTARYYRSADVADADAAARRLVLGLFEALLAQGSSIPERFRSDDELVSAATYLASLNDFAAVALAESLGVDAR